MFRSEIFKSIDPSVTHTITKLFLLSPQDFRGKHVFTVKGFAKNILFHFPGTRHFQLRIDRVHGQIQHSQIQKGRTHFKPPCHRGFVGSVAIIEMKIVHFSHSFFVQFFTVGSFVKIKVTRENFVGTFSRKDRLDPHGFNLSGKKIHGC